MSRSAAEDVGATAPLRPAEPTSVLTPVEPRHRRWWPWAAGALALLLVAAVLTLILSGGDDRPARDGRPAVLPNRYVNEAGGYSFRYPRGWKVQADGTATTLRAPGRAVVISFGVGPSGPLEIAAQRLADALSATYTDIENLGTEEQTISGHPALMVAGIGTNENGVRIRFLAITVATRNGNRSISVFTAEGSSPSTVLPPVQRIVSSFRPSGA